MQVAETTEVETEELDHQRHTAKIPRFRCESGEVLPDVAVAYETWGHLNAARDNVIVVCHALTGDAHAGPGALTRQSVDGWWSGLIGPHKALDTRRYFVVCTNVLGGCSGTTGPASTGVDGRRYGLRFPLVTVRDMVRLQKAVLDTLAVRGIEVVIGGSLGGMQVWEWLLEDKVRVKSGIVIAAHAAFPPLGIGYNAAMRRAITSDPAWQEGNYYDSPERPTAGLALARQIGLLTYRAGGLYDTKFERRQVNLAALQGSPATDAFLSAEYEVESYLDYNGEKFVRRFDPNTYLYLTKAMDGHDIGRNRGGLDQALSMIQAKTTVIGISSDYLYEPGHLAKTVRQAQAVGAPVTYQELHSPHGHDAFLIEYETLGRLITAHLNELG